MTEDAKNGAGPYDFALFVAKSFGKALPAIVIVVLVAAGSWHFVKELSLLQTRLIDAERELSTAKVNQAKAESAAQSAADKARGDIMAEQAKQIGQLNDASVNVSKKIQELVRGQLDNMSQLESKSQAQLAALQQRQKDEATAARAEIASLKKEVDALTSQRRAIATEIALSGYGDIKSKLIEELAKGYYPSLGSEPLLDLLRAKLTDIEVRRSAEADIKDSKITWQYRLLLQVELYRLTGDDRILQQVATFLETNKSVLNASAGRILQGRSTWSSLAGESISKLAMRWITDETASIAVRLSFIDALGWQREIEQLTWKYSFDERERITRGLNRLFLTAASDPSRPYCPNDVLELIEKFSEEAALVMVNHIRSAQQFSHIKDCRSTRQSLRGSDQRVPSEEERKRWLE